MMTTELCNQAVVDAQTHEIAYTKFMSANDSGETRSHQSGILLGNIMFGVFLTVSARPMVPQFAEESKQLCKGTQKILGSCQ